MKTVQESADSDANPGLPHDNWELYHWAMGHHFSYDETLVTILGLMIMELGGLPFYSNLFPSGHYS